jgi:hypothetical protein
MSYTNNPTSIIAGTGIVVTPITGTGANSVTISASGTQTVSVRNAIVTPVVVNGGDDVVSVKLQSKTV